MCYVRTDSGYGCQLCLGCELLLYAGYSYLVPGCIDNVGYCRYGAVIGYGGGCQRIDLRTYKRRAESIILFYFGTGPIRGFATTLIIGILCSFFTAVFLTRVVYEHFMNKDKWLGLTFTTGISKNLMQNVHYNFMGMMKRSFTVFGIIIAACVVSFFIRGLAQSIDFTGGRNFVVQFEQQVEPETVRDLLKQKITEDNVQTRKQSVSLPTTVSLKTLPISILKSKSSCISH